jgi:hypothetical protein
MMTAKPRLVMPAILKKAELAMKAAVRQVMIDHKQKSLPIYIFQHNKVVRILPQHIRIR